MRLRQVLLHLPGNTMKFTDTGKARLEISVVCSSSPAAALLFGIVDAGIGMTPHTMNLHAIYARRIGQFAPL